MSKSSAVPPQQASVRRATKQGQLSRTRERVLSAAIEILAREGYQATTIERIAGASGVARSTIYRHWGSVAEVAMSAFEQGLGEQMQTPDTGNVRSDLLAVYQNMVQALEHTRWGRIVPAMLEAALHDQDFAALLHQYVYARRGILREVLDNACARGELSNSGQIDDLLDPIVGAVYYRLLLTDRPQTSVQTLEYWINQALAGLAQVPDKTSDTEEHQAGVL